MLPPVDEDQADQEFLKATFTRTVIPATADGNCGYYTLALHFALDVLSDTNQIIPRAEFLYALCETNEAFCDFIAKNTPEDEVDVAPKNELKRDGLGWFPKGDTVSTAWCDMYTRFVMETIKTPAQAEHQLAHAIRVAIARVCGDETTKKQTANVILNKNPRWKMREYFETDDIPKIALHFGLAFLIARSDFKDPLANWRERKRQTATDNYSCILQGNFDIKFDEEKKPVLEVNNGDTGFGVAAKADDVAEILHQEPLENHAQVTIEQTKGAKNYLKSRPIIGMLYLREHFDAWVSFEQLKAVAKKCPEFIPEELKHLDEFAEKPAVEPSSPDKPNSSVAQEPEPQPEPAPEQEPTTPIQQATPPESPHSGEPSSNASKEPQRPEPDTPKTKTGSTFPWKYVLGIAGAALIISGILAAALLLPTPVGIGLAAALCTLGAAAVISASALHYRNKQTGSGSPSQPSGKSPIARSPVPDVPRHDPGITHAETLSRTGSAPKTETDAQYTPGIKPGKGGHS